MTFKNQVFKERVCCICDSPFSPNSPCHRVCSKDCRRILKNRQRVLNRKVSNKDKECHARSREKHPLRYMLYSAKRRALKGNLDFDLKVTDLVKNERCPIFNLELKYGLGSRSDNSASLDRIDPKIGYVKGNVHIISDRANRIKNDSTIEELELLVSYLKGLKE